MRDLRIVPFCILLAAVPVLMLTATATHESAPAVSSIDPHHCQRAHPDTTLEPTFEELVAGADYVVGGSTSPGPATGCVVNETFTILLATGADQNAVWFLWVVPVPDAFMHIVDDEDAGEGTVFSVWGYDDTAVGSIGPSDPDLCMANVAGDCLEMYSMQVQDTGVAAMTGNGFGGEAGYVPLGVSRVIVKEFGSLPQVGTFASNTHTHYQEAVFT
ncbi:MAG: hypothetical protein ACT4PT_01870 [Methanobacteriota archaeon]